MMSVGCSLPTLKKFKPYAIHMDSPLTDQLQFLAAYLSHNHVTDMHRQIVIRRYKKKDFRTQATLGTKAKIIHL